jgi:arylsulfatase A-like enzyme
LDKNTIVVYSSDQGVYLGEHGWFDKRWMYEESFRMPLLMRWPGRIKPGTRVDRLTQNIDFAPTLLDAAGVPVPKDMQGKSLLPLLSGKKVEWRKSIYYHYYEEGGGHGVTRHYGVRTANYKLIHYYAYDEWELFDMRKDPHEMNNVYNNPEYREIRERLKAELVRLERLYDVKPEDDKP